MKAAVWPASSAWLSWVVSTLVLTLGAGPARAQPADGYRFSPVNQYGLQLTASYWNPIIDYVSSVSGVKLQLKIGRTSADTTGYVLAQEVDFAFTNHLFSPERERMGWKVIARRDAPPVRGQIVVMEHSPLRHISQLKDAEVGFPGPEAFIAYRVTYAQLISQGIPVKVIFGGNMDSALTQLASGKVAAVGGNSQLIEGFSKRQGHRLRVLWSSEAYHDLALMASPRARPADVAAVQRAFLGMAADPAGRAVLAQSAKAVDIGTAVGFVAAKESDFDNYRRFYATAPHKVR